VRLLSDDADEIAALRISSADIARDLLDKAWPEIGRLSRTFHIETANSPAMTIAAPQATITPANIVPSLGAQVRGSCSGGGMSRILARSRRFAQAAALGRPRADFKSRDSRCHA